MFNIFLKGGPVMWPLLLVSLVSTSVVIERLIFLCRTTMSRRPDIVNTILLQVQLGNIDEAAEACPRSEFGDFL